MKYLFKEDFIAIQNAKNADPQKIGEALEKITAAHGGYLEPLSVVDAARDKKSVLHAHFEWDDALAANKFRLDQARALIRSIRVEDSDTDDGHIQAFVSVAERGGVAYRPIDAIRTSADLQAKVLAQAERDLDAWQKRYRSLQDVCAIVQKAQELVKRKRKQTQTESRAQA